MGVLKKSINLYVINDNKKYFFSVPNNTDSLFAEIS